MFVDDVVDDDVVHSQPNPGDTLCYIYVVHLSAMEGNLSPRESNTINRCEFVITKELL